MCPMCWRLVSPRLQQHCVPSEDVARAGVGPWMPSLAAFPTPRQDQAKSGLGSACRLGSESQSRRGLSFCLTLTPCQSPGRGHIKQAGQQVCLLRAFASLERTYQSLPHDLCLRCHAVLLWWYGSVGGERDVLRT